MTARAGFTLLELMIIIVVGMIIAGTVLPAVHTLDDQQISAEAQILAADLEFAQARAIATGQSHRILFKRSDDLYRVESPPGVLLLEPLSKKKWSRVLVDGSGYGTDLAAADFNGTNAVIFDAAGRPDAGGSVTLARGDFKAVISVAAVTGEVTLTLP